MGTIHDGQAARQRTRLRAAEAKHGGEVDGEAVPPLIAEGEYDAVGVAWRRAQMMGGAPRVVVTWDVLVPDANSEFGVRRERIEGFYRVREGPGRRIRAPRSSDLARDVMRVTGKRIQRADRISPGCFVGVLCRVDVGTVKKDHRQHDLPECAQYSRVKRILERKAGGSQE